jgi:hypothetical protein
MFGKAKGDSQEKDRLLPPAPQLPASLAEAASKEISCIDRGMTVVGKMPARNKDVAALDPLIRFGGTAEGRKVVTAFHRADPQVHRLLAQHVEAMVRFTSR